ncbi:MAG: hypothetical protein AAF911_05425 [Planctomycetota bacterium]
MKSDPSQIAYAAMFDFLSRYYEMTNDDGVGGLLGGLSLLNDGQPADRAFWADWMTSFEKASQGSVDLGLKTKKGDESP